jgi:hypothetical protein
LAAARLRLIRCAIPAPRKGHVCQGLGKGDVVLGALKGWAFVKGRQAKLRINDGLRDQGLKHQLRLGSKGNVK